MQLVHHFDEIKLTMKGFPFREMTYKKCLYDDIIKERKERFLKKMTKL